MIILGIETSCDDTGVAIVEAIPTRKTVGTSFKILSNIVSSQIKIHQKYGGVVPNLAAREHLKNLEPCLRQAFAEAKITPENIDLITATIGPGLIPCLLIGVNFAKTLAYVWKKPIIGVNHIEAHIIANYFENSEIKFPAIALVVSGGHTQLILMTPQKKSKIFRGASYKILGETRDDAAGECFDKVAKLLGLGYPGGPAIAREAKKLQATSYKLNLPRPMIGHKNYDFSFSGLKTAVLYLLKDMKDIGYPSYAKGYEGYPISHICAEVQQAIIDVLIEKTMRAAQEYRAKTVILSGGVAANDELRKQLSLKCKVYSSKLEFLTPSKILCTDNAAMIAMAGYFRYIYKPKSASWRTGWKKITADANLRLKN